MAKREFGATLVGKKLDIFLAARGKDRGTFVREFFEANRGIDQSNIASWFEGKKPQTDSIRKIAEYVIRTDSSKKNKIRVDHFYDAFTLDEFAQIIGRSHGEIALKLPGNITRMPPEMVDYLRGTYLIYRNSFGKFGVIAKETLVLCDEESSPRVMGATLFGISTGDYVEGECKLPEVRSGVFFRYGRCFEVITAFASLDEERKKKDKRLCYLQFTQQEDVGRLAHYGMVHGYSASLGNPASGRAVALKISNRTAPPEPGQATAWKLDRDSAEVKDFIDLLSNQIGPEDTCLASDRSSTRLQRLSEIVREKYWSKGAQSPSTVSPDR